MTTHTLTPNRLAVLQANCKRSSESRREKVALQIATYQTNPKRCNHCSSPIAYNRQTNKFCSQTCAASSTNKARGARTKSTKDKISATLETMWASKPKRQCDVNCIICETKFQTKPLGKQTRKTCSSLCLTESRSRTGRKSAAIRIVRSKDEIALYQLCLELLPDSQHNVALVDGWDADISIPSMKIAILWNGIWHREQMSFKNHSLVQVQTRDKHKIEALTKAGWQVIVYNDNEYTPEEALKDLVGRIGFEPMTPEL
jgi:G:T-mismatch repair DNA endonuclease (very short patch repair protein)